MLGVYVLHLFAIEDLETVVFHSLSLPIAFGVPVHSVCCFALCLAVAAVLRRIPFVGKYLC